MELFKKCDEVKVFRDPIHAYIHVEYQIIYDLINTDTFQRLRRIKQLGAANMVYPSAEHTRFSHSLGVYEIVRRMISENEHIAKALNDQEKIYVMVAGLLHDIGHGPFSHAFENITKINHEKLSALIIEGESEINTILENYQAGTSKIIASIIKHQYPKKLCWQMISSQLDADRMDYLLRDAYFTGTKYGEFDLERILRTLRVIDDSLVVKSSGIYAVEDYLMARFHMFYQVYYHLNIRIYEHMLAALCERIKEINIKEDITKLIDAKDLDLSLYLAFDDYRMFELFKKLSHHEDPTISDLSNRLLNRRLFNEYDNDEKTYQRLLENLKALNLDHHYYLLKEEANYNATRPYVSSGKQKINILLKDGSIEEFSKVSSIMKSLSNTNERIESYIFSI